MSWQYVCQLSNENKKLIVSFFLGGDYTLPCDVDYIQPLVDKDPLVVVYE